MEKIFKDIDDSFWKQFRSYLTSKQQINSKLANKYQTIIEHASLSIFISFLKSKNWNYTLSGYSDTWRSGDKNIQKINNIFDMFETFIQHNNYDHLTENDTDCFWDKFKEYLQEKKKLKNKTANEYKATMRRASILIFFSLCDNPYILSGYKNLKGSKEIHKSSKYFYDFISTQWTEIQKYDINGQLNLF